MCLRVKDGSAPACKPLLHPKFTGSPSLKLAFRGHPIWHCPPLSILFFKCRTRVTVDTPQTENFWKKFFFQKNKKTFSFKNVLTASIKTSFSWSPDMTLSPSFNFIFQMHNKWESWNSTDRKFLKKQKNILFWKTF